MLECLAKDVWTEQRSLRFFGLETGTRMTIVRLASGGLFVHSPVALDAELRTAVDALGPVTAIIAPSRFHHLYVGEWAAAYPAASVSACPGLEKKRKDIAWSRILGDEPAGEWRDNLDQVFFGDKAPDHGGWRGAWTRRVRGQGRPALDVGPALLGRKDLQEGAFRQRAARGGGGGGGGPEREVATKGDRPGSRSSRRARASFVLRQ